MKKAILLMVLSCGMFTTEAQTILNFPAPNVAVEKIDATSVHLGLGLSVPFPFGGVFSATFSLKSGWGGSVTYNTLSLGTTDYPSDYMGGSWVIFGNDDGNPFHDDIYATSIRILKEFPIEKKFRVGLEAGPSFVRIKSPGNFQYNPNPCSFLGCPANYTWEEVTNKSVGLSLKGKLEFPVSVPFGFEIGLTSNLNPDRSFFGVEFLLNLGYLRKE